MNWQELKTSIENGHYQPQPERIAQAMLRRRGVRSLLMAGCAFGPSRSGKLGGGPLNSAGRIPPAPESPRQAA
jgi:hypothetical protein